MSDYRTFNTTVSGSALLSSLSGDDVRALAFDGELKQSPVKGVTGNATPMFVEDWVQASLGGLMLSALTGSIDLGLDDPDTALQYINLFNLESTGSNRILKFILGGPTGAALTMKNTTGTLGQYVQVNVQGVSTVATGAQALFNNVLGATGPCPGEGAGYTRIVQVKPISLDSGSEVVQFNILPRSL